MIRGQFMFVLAGGFLILSPLSMAAEIDAAGFAKYLRLGVTCLIVGCGVLSGSLLRLKSTSAAFLPFIFLWSVSPVWSSSPVWGLFHKGMFTLVFLSGLATGMSTRRLPDLESGLRLLSFVAAMTAFVVLFEYVRNPSGSTLHGRLSVAGVNANTIGQTAAPLAVFCAYLALYGRKGRIKSFATAGFGLLLIILLLSGSRGGIASAVLGCGVLMIPVSKRPGILLLSVAVIFGFAYIAMDILSHSEDVRAIAELTKDTRTGVWKAALRAFRRSPLFGHGWFSQAGGTRWATFQSAYLQVLVETGIIGAGVLGVGLLTIAFKLKAARRCFRQVPGIDRVWYLAAGTIASSLFHGAVESSMVVGTSLTPFVLAFGIGVLDRIPEYARAEAGARMARLRRQWIMRTLGGRAVAPGYPVLPQLKTW